MSTQPNFLKLSASLTSSGECIQAVKCLIYNVEPRQKRRLDTMKGFLNLGPSTTLSS